MDCTHRWECLGYTYKWHDDLERYAIGSEPDRDHDAWEIRKCETCGKTEERMIRNRRSSHLQEPWVFTKRNADHLKESDLPIIFPREGN